jgi:dienelactone hydrolase
VALASAFAGCVVVFHEIGGLDGHVDDVCVVEFEWEF